jgi:hypothetical protein
MVFLRHGWPNIFPKGSKFGIKNLRGQNIDQKKLGGGEGATNNKVKLVSKF